jgi:hypothetical protein
LWIHPRRPAVARIFTAIETTLVSEKAFEWQL